MPDLFKLISLHLICTKLRAAHGWACLVTPEGPQVSRLVTEEIYSWGLELIRGCGGGHYGIVPQTKL